MSDPTQTRPSETSLPDGPNQQPEDLEPLTLIQMFGSAIAAMIGVQSKEKRERDFARGKASQFVIVGLVLTAAFVLIMAGVVSVVLNFVT